MQRLAFISFVFCLLSACKTTDRKADTGNEITIDSLTSSEITELVNNWKTDSVGCLRLRDPEKMMILTKQLQLIGKDSLAVLTLLGKPNSKYGEDGDRHFLYFLECGVGKKSYYNFYCHMKGDTVSSFSSATF
ncbi:MAG: hypothetical protein ACK5RG_14900 [Cyclobacteriaceae bacterium]|jgi:hypothetical protein|nr:hypothetical protein [Flammeovirgaceae bacterium]